MTPPRLHPDTLAQLPAEVRRPRYDRSQLRAGIVHLGLGAFARAHLAVATEAALQSRGDLRWGIVGVSLRQADTAQALSPQAGLYTLALRDADERGAPRERLQVIGALMQVLVAPDNPGAVLERMAHPDTRIVSLTVTEKGYHHDPATGQLRLQDDDIAHDLRHPEAPRSTLGFVVHGLDRRLQRGLPPITLMSCDNLPANGHTLRGLVLAFAQEFNPALATWIAAECSFPNAMVDRIVPRTTDADRTHISTQLQLNDAWPVLAEPFMDWVVEDHFVAGRPDWPRADAASRADDRTARGDADRLWPAPGVRIVPSAEPFEKLKLRMVNGSHSALAYLGASAGWATVDRAVADPALKRFIDRMMRDEIAPTLPALPGLDLDHYRAQLLQRFANPALQHRTRQIAMDGSQKLPQRLLGTVRDRLQTGQPLPLLALAVGAWLNHLRGVDDAGQPFSIDDPLAQALARQMTLANEAAAMETSADPGLREQRRVGVLCSFAPVFGGLDREAAFVQAVARHTGMLRDHGVAATLRALH
jgi:fructuronate reductase